MAKKTMCIEGARQAQITCDAGDVPRFVASMYDCGFVMLKASVVGRYLDMNVEALRRLDVPVELSFWALKEQD